MLWLVGWLVGWLDGSLGYFRAMKVLLRWSESEQLDVCFKDNQLLDRSINNGDNRGFTISIHVCD